METRYCDTQNVADAVDELTDRSLDDEDASLSVYDGDVVMTGISHDEASDRNLFGHMGDEVCSFRYDGTRLTLSFHENQVVTTFELTPAGTSGIVVNQTNPLSELAPAVDDVVQRLEDEFDLISCDFMGVESASIASGGHFTSFEFEYAVTSTQW